MADYGAQAAAIYDPQQKAEGSSLAVARDTATQGLKDEAASIDPYYSAALKKAGQDRSEAGAKQDAYSIRSFGGYFGDGTNTNQQRILDEKLQDTDKTLTSEQAQKHASIASRTSLASNNYTTGMSALAAKYAGLKSQYITSAQQRDADIARQEADTNRQHEWDVQKSASDQRFTASQNALNRPAPAGPTAAQRLNENINNAFANLDVRPRGYTESVIIPNLIKEFGGDMSTGDIEKAVYSTRKALGYG